MVLSLVLLPPLHKCRSSINISKLPSFLESAMEAALVTEAAELVEAGLAFTDGRVA
jgi:hypothetical protein